MKVYELIEKLLNLSNEEKQRDVMVTYGCFELHDIIGIGVDFAKCDTEAGYKPVITISFNDEDLS